MQCFAVGKLPVLCTMRVWGKPSCNTEYSTEFIWPGNNVRSINSKHQHGNRNRTIYIGHRWPAEGWRNTTPVTWTWRSTGFYINLSLSTMCGLCGVWCGCDGGDGVEDVGELVPGRSYHHHQSRCQSVSQSVLFNSLPETERKAGE